MKVQLLTEENDYFYKVLDSNFDLWYKQEDWSKEKLKEYLLNSLNTTRLPMTLIVVENEEVIGTCQLAMNDLDVRPQYYPWLINLSVDENYRGRGIGKLLIQTVLKKIDELGYNELYLYTAHKYYFEQFGFTLLEKVKKEPEVDEVVRVYQKLW